LGFTEKQVQEIATGTDLDQVDAGFQEAFKEAETRIQAADPDQLSRLATRLAEVLDEMEAAARAYESAGFPIVGSEVNSFTEESEHFLEIPGQARQIFGSREEALDAWRDWQNQQEIDALDILREAANSELIDFLTGE